MGLQLADVENDPLVKDTVKVFRDAIKEIYKDRDYGPDDRRLVPQFDNPLLRVLIETDSLDSVSAAVLSADHLLGWVSVNDLKTKLDPDVAGILELFHGDGPEALLESKNPVAM